MEGDLSAFMMMVTDRLDSIQRQLDALKSVEVPSTPTGNTVRMPLRTDLFSRNRGDDRRDSILGSVGRHQTIPKFDSKHTLDVPVTLPKAWMFLTEVKRYLLDNPDATLFRSQSYITQRAKNFIVGRNATMREQDFDDLSEQDLAKELLAVVKPGSKKEFLQSFIEMVKYEASVTTGNTSSKYIQPQDYREQHDLTKLVSGKAADVYNKLCGMVHHNEDFIPSTKPDAKRPKESMIEAFEGLLSAKYLALLKENKKKAFHEAQWNFVEYVTLMENVNQVIYLKMEPAIPMLEMAQSMNRTTRLEDENHAKLLMQTYRQKPRSEREVPRVQAIDEMLLETDEIMERRKHHYAGGLAIDDEEDVGVQVSVEIDDEEGVEHGETQSTFDPDLIAAMDRAVQGVRWNEKAKPAGILKVQDGGKPVCWHFLHSKGEGCPKGSSCPNSHDAHRIKEELAKMSSFWNSK
jgi:hypothetical protein